MIISSNLNIASLLKHRLWILRLECHIEHSRLDPVALHLRYDSMVESIQHARHAHHHGGLQYGQITGQVLEVTKVDANPAATKEHAQLGKVTNFNER